MTPNIDLNAEQEAYLNVLANETEEMSEEELSRSMMLLSESVFNRVWDNDEDSVYDTL